MVVLARGSDPYYLLRTHRDGSIDLDVAGWPLDAYARYARLVTELADELEARDGEHALARVSPLLPGMVRAWLYRTASEAMADQARVTAGVGLKGLVTTGVLRRGVRHPGSMSVAELARMLHTDPARLSRAIAAASAPTGATSTPPAQTRR